jgi:hypothetical protein
VHQDQSVTFQCNTRPTLLSVEAAGNSFKLFTNTKENKVYLKLTDGYEWVTCNDTASSIFHIDSGRSIDCHNEILQFWQLQRFLLEGYLQINDVVPSSARKSLLARLNQALGIPGSIVPGTYNLLSKLLIHFKEVYKMDSENSMEMKQTRRKFETYCLLLMLKQDSAVWTM